MGEPHSAQCVRVCNVEVVVSLSVSEVDVVVGMVVGGGVKML